MMTMFKRLMKTIDAYVADAHLREAMRLHAHNWACDDDDCRCYIERIVAGERSPLIGDEPFEYDHMNAGDFVAMLETMMATKH